MTLSIIIPVYNVGNYLKDCLDSVLRQQCKEEIEIICVNDESTDDSQEILMEYEAKYTCLHVYEKRHEGLSSARNYGLNKAQGKFVFFLDSDDMLADERCFSFMIETMEKQKLDVLYFDGKSFFENEDIHQKNRFYDEAYQRKRSYGIYQYGKDLFADFVRNEDYYVQASLQCIRRKFLVNHELQFPDGILYEDNLFMFKEMLLAGKVMHQNYIVLLHRIRSGSIMQTNVSFHNFYSAIYIYKKMLQFWDDNKQVIDIRREIVLQIDAMKLFVVSIFYKISEKENNILKLSPCDQYLIDTLIKENINKDCDICFPYYLFNEGDHVVIYGAGNIGRKFYRYAMKDRVVNIVGIADSNVLEEKTEREIYIYPGYMVKNWDYDYILIAVENPIVAKEIKQQLLQMGVPEYKIKWDETVYLRRGKRRYYELNKFANSLMETYKKKIFHVLLPEHGNIGDHAIAIAEKSFLDKYFSTYSVIGITADEFFELQDFFVSKINMEDIIIFHGGGYIGDLWKMGENLKKMLAIFPDNKKIIFPNSFAYKKELKLDLIKEDLKLLFEDKKLHIFFRDKNSFNLYRKNIDKDRCYYGPDMALLLSNMDNQIQRKENNKKVLLIFRNDEEKIFQHVEYVKTVLKEKKINYIENDTNFNRYVSRQEEKYCFERLIETIKSCNLVITDRLHGMILSAICGIPCIAFDNLTHKVFDVYKWIEKRKNVILCDEQKLEKISQFIDTLLVIGFQNYEPMENEFEKMARIIEKIIL